MIEVVVTGTLEGMTRKEAGEVIEGLGAKFSKRVTYETNYLVATKLDSIKALRARELGVEVISQSEFQDFVDAGNFPENDKPEKRERNYTNNFPVLRWAKVDDGEPKLLEYFDADGVITTRIVKFVASAVHVNSKGASREYWLAADMDDAGRQKTFRGDRIHSVRSL